MDDTILYGDSVFEDSDYLEQRYTSTTAKLLAQDDRFSEWRRGIYRPISLQLAPTDKCNLDCSFCSVKNRVGDQISFEEAARCLDDLARLGLKSVEFTGGGEPTMYPCLNNLIELADGLKLRIGLITNGLLLTKKVNQRYLDMLDWVRISMNSLDYVPDIEIPVFRKMDKLTTLGLSYVVNESTTKYIVKKIFNIIDQYDVDFLRVVPNCLSIDTIDESRRIAASVAIIEHPLAFWQQKKHSVPAKCRIGYLKPFLNADGYFYHCSANPLIDRKFNHKFRMARVNEVDYIWNGDYKPFCTDKCQDGKCFFKEHNELLELFLMNINHRDFV